MENKSRLLILLEEIYVIGCLFLVLMGYIYICLIFHSIIPYIIGFTIAGMIICYLLIRGSSMDEK